MTRKILIIALIVSVLAHAFIFWKSRAREDSSIYSYLSNYQYVEQTSIFDAYGAPCSVAFIGDSHIYKCHWDELLGIPVCNRGIGSDITEGVYNRIGDIIDARPKICFIACGANDIDRHISADTTMYYFRKIIDTLRGAGIRPIIMEVTPVSDEYPNKFFNKSAQLLNNGLSTLGETISIETKPAYLQSDGIHLTGEGYLRWKEKIKEKLNS